MGRLINRLAQLRFERIAAKRDEVGAADWTTPRREDRRDRRCAGGHPRRRSPQDIAPALAAGGTFDAVRSRISLAALQRIEAFPAFVKGMGVITEVGVMPDHPYWIQWWQRTEAGPVADNHHVLDPAREDFYDYRDARFRRLPRATRAVRLRALRRLWRRGRLHLTVAVRSLDDGSFYGVTCVDILVADLESWLSPLLARRGSRIC